MKRFVIHIPKYDWVVHTYIGTDKRYAYEILSVLEELGCNQTNLKKAKVNLISDNLDTGLTYSDKEDKVSVMVIGNTSSAKEFLDSLVHEIMHLSVHIAETYNIDFQSEELCYIGGDVARSLYPYCKEYLCCECNH